MLNQLRHLLIITNVILGLVHGDSSNVLPKYSEVAEEPTPIDRGDASSDEWQVTSGTSSSPHDVAGDLGMGSSRDRRRDPYDDDFYDDDLYDEPLQSPDAYEGRSWRQG